MHRGILSIKVVCLAACVSLFIAGCGGGWDGGSSSSSSPPPPSTDGQAGSMARFSLVGDYLYTISGKDMKLFLLAADPAVPSPFASIQMNWNIETLYSANNHLFVGARDGVYIFDNAEPSNPTQVSKFLHIESCDPVVVKGNYAYATLRNAGGSCGDGVNRMDVLDISDTSLPVLVKSYAMQNPKGLGIEGDTLFVCDDIAGLKAYSLADPANPVFLFTDSSLNCYDLIASTNTLVVSDKKGIFQLDYSIIQMDKLSHIQLVNP